MRILKRLMNVITILWTSSIFAADMVADFKDLECWLRAAEAGFSGDGYCKGLPLDEFYLEVTDGKNRYSTEQYSISDGFFLLLRGV